MRSDSVIRVLVVDDHEAVRQGLRGVLHMGERTITYRCDSCSHAWSETTAAEPGT
ncbi:MAG: hypothetical protein AB7N65_18205 [Vicinamibacterales bacterium]